LSCFQKFFLFAFNYPPFSKRIIPKGVKDLDSSQENKIFTAERAENAEEKTKINVVKESEDTFFSHSGESRNPEIFL
jgi:hypothetical protein